MIPPKGDFKITWLGDKSDLPLFEGVSGNHGKLLGCWVMHFDSAAMRGTFRIPEIVKPAILLVMGFLRKMQSPWICTISPFLWMKLYIIIIFERIKVSFP